MAASPSSPSQAGSRRPSELNAAADLVGLGGLEESSPTQEKEAGSSGKAKGDKSKSKVAADKKTVEPASSGEAKSDKTTDKKGQVTALSVMNELADATAEVDGPLKKKAKSSSSSDDQMLTDENGEKTSFPLLLHNVVSDPASDDCIHWLTCGTRFIISDKKKFAKDVLPKFYGPAKFTSFTRRLKRWSFARVPSGPFMGAYYNPNFLRGKPEMAHRVRYNHPSPLSGAGLAMQQQKLAGVKGPGGAGNMMMPMPNMSGMSDNERAELFRQINGGMNPMMGMNMGMMGMNYGMMMNPNMMMMGGGGMGGSGKEDGNNSGDKGPGAAAPAGGAGTNPALAMFREQQEMQQRFAFQQQMANQGGPNQGSMNDINNQAAGVAGAGGPQGMDMAKGGNLSSILAQYVNQGNGSRGSNQGNAEGGDNEV